ncbi:MAG: hypothetical protein OMM_15101, partial [Candidatus Magnetoglobus multicellularis str. Araruama]
MSGKGQNESFLENPSQYSFVGDNRFDLHFRNQFTQARASSIYGYSQSTNSCFMSFSNFLVMKHHSEVCTFSGQGKV